MVDNFPHLAFNRHKHLIKNALKSYKKRNCITTITVWGFYWHIFYNIRSNCNCV